MRFVNLSAAALTAAVLAGCAAGPSNVAPPQAAAGALALIPLEELPPQHLAKDQCALFLWSRGAAARRIVMALNEPPVARIRVGGRTFDLPRTDWDGASAFGHFAHQTFAADRVNLTLDLDLGDRRELLGGAVVPTGTLDYRDPAGWSAVIPVGGLIACQSGDPAAPKGP